MPRGIARSKFDFEKDTCKYSEQGGWCRLPKYKRCEDCLRCTDGTKACFLEI